MSVLTRLTKYASQYFLVIAQLFLQDQGQKSVDFLFELQLQVISLNMYNTLLVILLLFESGLKYNLCLCLSRSPSQPLIPLHLNLLIRSSRTG